MALINDRRRRGGGFSPATLDGLLLAMTADPGYVFQDLAGTTAAVAHGDPVGLTPHRFGGALDPSQSTDAIRPTLELALGDGRGPELVDNGTFDSDTSGWSGNNATLSLASNALRVTADANGEMAAFDTVATTSGKVYQVSVELVDDSTSASVSLRVDSAGSYPGAGGNLISSAALSVGVHTFTFTALSATTYISLASGGATLSGETMDWDNITVREVLRDGPRGIRSNGVNQFLDATGLTAASGPKTVIAGCITDDGESVAFQYLLDVQTGRTIYAAAGNAAGSAKMFDGGWTAAANYDTEELAVLTFKHYATNGGIRANGVEVLTENVTELAYSGGAGVGAGFNGASGWLNGVIHALLVFDRALTDKEIQLCEAWVAARQGRIL